MKQIAMLLAVMMIAVASCTAPKQMAVTTNSDYPNSDTLITSSLFNDKGATISEESIQKILDGTYKLPQQLRVAMVRLDAPSQRRLYWNDEQYLKTQQSYLDLFSNQFKQSNRITKISLIPDLLIAKSPSFTQLREAAVRMQADVVVVYAINSDLYSKYKLFSKADIKAFATTQLIILDVRTGLVPFSTIITKDYLSQKSKDELDNAEAARRIQNEAVLMTINEIGQQVTTFLNTK